MKIWGQGNDLGSPWAILENWHMGSQQPGLPSLPMGHTLPFSSCLYSFFNSLPHAICQISYKKSPVHTRTHRHIHTGTEEPSADPGIDSKNSHLHWSSGFIQLHLPELFVWLCNVKSSVLLLELFMLSSCFQNSFPRCIWHLPTASKALAVKLKNVCASHGHQNLYPGHLPGSDEDSWYLMERLKKVYRFNACGTLIIFQGSED